MEEVKTIMSADSEEQTFITKYLSIFDCKRQELSSMYDATAYCSWNGNGLNGIDEIMKFLMALPYCKHKLHLLDVQPVKNVDGIVMMITAGGLVTYNDNETYNFQKFLIVKKVNGNFIILSDCVSHNE